MKSSLRSMAVVIALLLTLPAVAHHSYAMFDLSQRRTVSGTLAKVEWSNPHVSVWVYVHKHAGQQGFELYAFEAGGVNFMSRLGWTPRSFSVGEKINVDYCPLKDGGNGGALIKVTHSDGSFTQADPGGVSPVGACGVHR